MPQRASSLLASILDRVTPPRRRRAARSYAWEPGSQWSGDWRSSEHRDRGRAAGASVPPDAPTTVGVTVEGPVWDPTDPVVEGEIVEEPEDAAAAATAGTTDADRDAGRDATREGPPDDAAGGSPAGAAAAARGTSSPPDAAPAAPDDETAGGSGADAWPPAPDLGPPPPRRLRDEAVWGGAIALAVVLVLAVVVNFRAIGDWLLDQRVEQSAESFAGAWERGDLGRVTYDRGSAVPAADREDVSGAVARLSRAAVAGLTTRSADAPSDVTLVGPVTVAPGLTEGDRTASQRLRVRWTLDRGREWTYTTTVGLRERGNRWRVVWTPQVVHPALRAGEGLVAQRVQAPRAPILAADGAPLVRTGTLYRVTFVYDSLIRPYGDLDRLAEALGLRGAPAKRLVDRATSTPRRTPVELATVQQAEWDKIRGKVLAVKGTSAAAMRVPLPLVDTYGGQPIGDVRPASRSTAAASGGRLLTGELTGVSGLQKVHDDQLRGTPGLRVVVRPEPRDRDRLLAPYAVTADDRTGRPVADLAAPVAGEPLRVPAP